MSSSHPTSLPRPAPWRRSDLSRSAIFLPRRLDLLLGAGCCAPALLTTGDGIAPALETEEFAKLSHQFD
jgi:hypothetical protein